eukprot:989080-Rhodomonas_salina.1
MRARCPPPAVRIPYQWAACPWSHSEPVRTCDGQEEGGREDRDPAGGLQERRGVGFEQKYPFCSLQ